MDCEFIEKVLELYPEFIRTNGPYTRKDGREILILRRDDGSKTSISLPKILVEVHLGRRLKLNETVDHIDKNVLNNEISNLQILDRSEHSSLDCKRRKPFHTNCTICGENIEVTRGQLRRDKTGFFCSRRCSGIYGSLVRQNKIEKVDKEYDLEYYTMKERE